MHRFNAHIGSGRAGVLVRTAAFTAAFVCGLSFGSGTSAIVSAQAPEKSSTQEPEDKQSMMGKWMAKLGIGGKADYIPFTARAANFEMQYPKKDWIVLPGYGKAFAIVAETKGGATVGVEYSPSEVTLALIEIDDGFAKIEQQIIQEARPKATGLSSQFRDFPGGRAVVIDFVQEGFQGPEHVRQYVIPKTNAIFRVVCTSNGKTFPKFENLFEYMAGTLVSPPPAQVSKN